MRDRVAANPNRYAVYDDNHNFLRYEYHERADNPTEVGTPLNKANLLSDATAQAIKTLSESSSAPGTINDALSKITSKTQTIDNTKLKIEAGSYTGTGTYGASNPNSLTFSFTPKIVLISCDSEHTTYWTFQCVNIYIWGNSGFATCVQGNSPNDSSGTLEFASVFASVSGNTMSWYNNKAARYQLNDNNTTGSFATTNYYNYVAIG